MSIAQMKNNFRLKGVSSHSSHSASSCSISPRTLIQTPYGEVSWEEIVRTHPTIEYRQRWVLKSYIKREINELELSNISRRLFADRRYGRLEKYISDKTIACLRKDLFNVVKNHFRVPVHDTFKMSAHLISQPNNITPEAPAVDKNIIVYSEVDTRLCEQEYEKCRKCTVRYRCITSSTRSDV